MEHVIYFQVFTTTAAFASFLLDNRLVKVRSSKPGLTLLRVDLANEQTIKPHHVVTLACLLEEYWLAGIPIRFEASDSVVYAYLRDIGFLRQWDANTRTAPDGFTLPADSTSFVFWKVEPESMADYAESAYRHYKAHFFQGKDLSVLPTYLAEIFNNIFDHAFAAGAAERIAYCMVQYYPATERLFIAVADFGMGIPNSVNRYLESQQQNPLPPIEALKQSLELHFSAKSRPHNRGRGLNTLSTGLAALGGTLTIQTSHALYHVDSSGKAYPKDLAGENFPGTTVAIRLLHERLPAEEPDVLDGEASLF
ncbi:hypothetical protein KLP40_08835 [Hymenobacter sp. NST-14]|uniref:hypothetical protein n=1 Tax=Hymenobacter piscis TaxID=2839984 RepID=UPI001C00D951|nr:hypothetical protein [Hymenobacter piscis]MBT9393267.1 hypothetical protein [Hymenobacter piscis]